MFMCPGHERWHPNPAFYYDVGGGPMLDMGPYYITDLVNLLGPVARVSGIATTSRARCGQSPRKNGAGETGSLSTCRRMSPGCFSSATAQSSPSR